MKARFKYRICPTLGQKHRLVRLCNGKKIDAPKLLRKRIKRYRFPKKLFLNIV